MASEHDVSGASHGRYVQMNRDDLYTAIIMAIIIALIVIAWS